LCERKEEHMTVANLLGRPDLFLLTAHLLYTKKRSFGPIYTYIMNPY